MKTLTKITIAAVAVAALSIGGIALTDAITPEPTVAPANERSVVVTPEPTETPTATPTPVETEQPTPEPVQEAPAPVEVPVAPAPVVPEPEPAPYVPVRCPAGTTANAVADNGDESNCIENNPETGAQCVAFDDANNCTAWLEQ